MVPVKLSSSAIEPDFNKLDFKSLKDETCFDQQIPSKDAIHYVEYKKSMLMSNSKSCPLTTFMTMILLKMNNLVEIVILRAGSLGIANM
jgi:hypothetical protein